MLDKIKNKVNEEMGRFSMKNFEAKVKRKMEKDPNGSTGFLRKIYSFPKFRNQKNQIAMIDLLSIADKVELKETKTKAEKAFLDVFIKIDADKPLTRCLFWPNKDGENFAKTYLAKIEHILDYEGYEDSEELINAHKVVAARVG